MTGKLPKKVEIMGAEPCVSLLSRLAERNDISASELASVLGLRWSDVKIGSNEAIRATASLAETDVLELRKATPRLFTRRLYVWRGNRLPDRLIRSKDIHVCQCCIEDDIRKKRQSHFFDPNGFFGRFEHALCTTFI